MQYKNIDFHNVGELVDFAEDGLLLSRYPNSISQKLGFSHSTKGQEKSKNSSGCEIRFLCPTAKFNIKLKNMGSDTYITIFHGDLQHSKVLLRANEISDIAIIDHQRLIDASTNILPKRRFSQHVWRIAMDYDSKISFINLDTYGIEYKNPEVDDLPIKNILCYGSSISQGAGALSYNSCYVNLLAEFSNFDTINKGLAGSCLLESEAIDYLITYETDYYLFEIGCNVRGLMDESEFEKRFHYLISSFIKAHPHKPIIVISILDFFTHCFSSLKTIPYNDKNLSFHRIICDTVSKLQNGNITLIPASKLMPCLSCTSGDMLHPSNYGHLMMAINLKDYFLD